MPAMRKRKTRLPSASPMMFASLMAASWETVWRRSMMMAQGTCSAAEYHRMTAEKAAAVQQSVIALATGRGGAAMVRPFLTKAQANARRLRRK